MMMSSRCRTCRVLLGCPVRLCFNRHTRSIVGIRHGQSTQTRAYATPARIKVPSKLAYKPPPPPPVPSLEVGHSPGTVEEAEGPFDQFLADTALSLFDGNVTSVSELHAQYRERAGRTIDLVVPYEERPAEHRRADSNHQPDGSSNNNNEGDGLLMVVHALRKANGKLDKICACSGFVVNAQSSRTKGNHGEVVITCAHTLEEMYRNIKRTSKDQSIPQPSSLSFVITSTGEARIVSQVLSSMPKSDVISLQIAPSKGGSAAKLRTLPVSPFPVHAGSAVLTHLFAASQAPVIRHSASRLPSSAKSLSEKVSTEIEQTIPWLQSRAFRRWGSGVMLGYRSYTGIEVEAGIHSSLPHILTSILPTPGSSGGPLVCAETGSVVGMISGRRMDNRVEGERGWGCSSEGIFEMFSLPGFTPTSHKD